MIVVSIIEGDVGINIMPLYFNDENEAKDLYTALLSLKGQGVGVSRIRRVRKSAETPEVSEPEVQGPCDEKKEGI
jgi:hypothetical protein